MIRRSLLALLLAAGVCCAQERRNWFDDPFLAATSGFAACPMPEGPLMTEAEMRRHAHYRAERGTSCWLAKKCDQPNAYAHDPDIARRVQTALARDPQFRSSSVWLTVQRKFVFLQGCAASQAQRRALLAQARAEPEVELVIDELMIGTRGTPPYRVAH